MSRSFVSIMMVMLGVGLAAADDYAGHVQPFMERFCVECHNAKTHKADLDLTRYVSESDVTSNFRRWNNIVAFIRGGEMPPEDAAQPEIDERNAVIECIESMLLKEAIKHAGDPGVVLPRRLSNTEYDTAVRDLTGVDIRPTRDFPADPAGGEGFDNTGETLRTSPSLVNKYLAAAQMVADHMVLKPDGVSFAPFPVTSYNERKKLTELAIIDFYESHDVDTLAYLVAAKARQAALPSDSRDPGYSEKYLSLLTNTLDDASNHQGWFGELGRLWDSAPAPQSVDDQPVELRQLSQRIEFYRQLLYPQDQQLIKAGAGNWPISHLDYRARVANGRDQFDRQALNSEALIDAGRIHPPREDAKPYSLFLNIEPAFSDDDNSDEDNYVIVNRSLLSLSPRLPHNDQEAANQQVETLRSVLQRFDPDLEKTLSFGVHPLGATIDADAFVVKAPALIEIPVSVEMQQAMQNKHLVLLCQLDPQHGREGSVFINHASGEPPKPFAGATKHLAFADSETAEQLAESAGLFCQAFPNRFYFADETRGLTAGFHLVEGFFRDDRPLVEKVLRESELIELERLWKELDFVTQRTETLLRGFVWFERSEREVLHDERFNFLRAEDPGLVRDEVLDQFERLYLDKMGVERAGNSLQPKSPSERYDMIHGFFQEIRDGLARQRELESIALQRGLADLEQFASRAYRRPLTDEDRLSLHRLFNTLRKNGQPIESSLRGVLIAILMSPDFCYHWWQQRDDDAMRPLDNYELASRLSFFLWSSVPDEALLAAAREGELSSAEDLVWQTRRMLADQRVESFAREFFGQWLRYRDFLDKDPINAAAFPGYTDELRQAMFAEPSQLATHLIQNDGPVTELLTSDKTFVNEVLAKHYGGNIEQQFMNQTGRDKTEFVPVSGLRASGRGGLFGMAVILAKNSAGERTSPVKRAFWSVHHLLGQHFPPPPIDVPELPASEKSAERSIRELLAAHVADPQCAMCHKHIDALGLAMEGFDPIGRTRTTDAAGRVVDNVTVFPNGQSGVGVPGLIDYISEYRRQDFTRTLCRKFLGYALGRSVILSDQPLLNEMESALEENDYRFSVLFETVVRSSQFRNRRVAGKSTDGP